ncbi:isochorismatase family protein [Gemella cuniculi]|uniref:isochorismatase family protein n=1 Tax=Gemella cuniculi TaxID=150240 RepID=UPI0003F8F4A3|nr:isochorismatase family protein [Gemella cuniculi]
MEMLFKLLAEHVYLILFISLILEFAALPLPGETMMLFAGIMAYGGHASYIGMIIASALGTIIGMQFSYEVGRRLGTKAIDKYGGYVGLTPYRMTKASEFFNKYGNIVIIIAYYLPGVRHILGYFSGITKVDAKRFHLYSTFGGILWVGTFITLGYVLGPSAHRVFHLMHKYGTLAVIIGLVGLFVYLIYKKLGKKDFSIYFKKQLKFLSVPFILAIIIFIYKLITVPRIHPKFVSTLIFYVSIMLLIIVVFYYIRITLKNNTSKKALVVVDYQKDFVDGSLGLKDAEKIEHIISKKIEEYLKNDQDVIFTKDTHYTNYLSTREGKYIPVEHCIVDTSGHKLYGKIAEYEKDAKKIFTKTSFASIGLAKYISRSDYEEVEFCGLVSNICVLSNIVMVQNFNEKVEIKLDLNATKGMDSEIDNSLKKYLEQLTVNIIE